VRAFRRGEGRFGAADARNRCVRSLRSHPRRPGPPWRPVRSPELRAPVAAARRGAPPRRGRAPRRAAARRRRTLFAQR